MAKKRPKYGPDRENSRTLAPTLAGRHHLLCNDPAQDVTSEQAGHNKGIFLTKPGIHPRGDRTLDLEVLLVSV
jgi:hypothetical protein